MKILFLCSGSSSCRSMMAEAIVKNMDKTLDVYSAGLHPEPEVDPFAIQVMNEIGIDISQNNPVNYQKYEGMEVDYLITLCEGTKDKITSVNVQARHKIHLGFEDPRKTNCTDDEIITIYRNIRDEIKNELEYFYSRILKPETSSG
jgi:arsenate reductase (thioredoxin)